MKLEITQGHALDLATLSAHAQKRIAYYAERYPHLALTDHCRWVDDRVVSGSYKGGTGTVTIGDRDVRVALDLPFFARPFKGRIEDFVRRELALATTPAS